VTLLAAAYCLSGTTRTPVCGVGEEGGEHMRRAPYNNKSQVGLRSEGRHISPPGESALWYGIWSSFSLTRMRSHPWRAHQRRQHKRALLTLFSNEGAC